MLCFYFTFFDFKRIRFSFVIFYQSIVDIINSIDFFRRFRITTIDFSFRSSYYCFYFISILKSYSIFDFFRFRSLFFELFFIEFFYERFVYFDNNRINFNRIKINKINVDIFDFCFFSKERFHEFHQF